jgi:hypothetical protein
VARLIELDAATAIPTFRIAPTSDGSSKLATL